MLKRIISCLLAAAMLLSFGTVVFAEETFDFTVTITAEEKEDGQVAANENAFAGRKLKANVEVTSGSAEGVTYKYFWGDNDTGVYSLISSENYIAGNDFIGNWKTAFVNVTAYDSNNSVIKTVKATRYLGDAGKAGDRKASKAGIGVSAPTTDTSLFHKTDEGNVFVVGGKRFIVLDAFSNENEMFYVMADDTYGKRVFDTGKTSNGDKTLFKTGVNEYTSSGEGNIAYWLNHDFLENGNGEGNALPAEIKNNLAEHKYFEMKNAWDTSNEETVKVALLGRLEYIKYIDKFSPVINGNINDGWWLRDTQGCGQGDKHGPYRVIPSWDVVEGTGSLTASAYIRPTFYLGKDFFKTVHLDINTLGDNIKTLLLDKYTDEELLGVYSQAELNVLKKGKAIISSVTLSESKDALLLGTEENNYSITATPSLSAGQADRFKYQWYQGDVKLKNETNQTLIIGNDNAHYRTFKVEVTPVDSEGNAVGEPFMSESKYYGIPLQMLARRKIASSKEDIRFNSDDKYMFELDGKKFLVLDEFDSATESFYVLADDLYGKHVFDTNAAANESVLFSIEKTYTRGDETITVSSGEGNIAYWLNNDFLENGNGEGNALPDGIKNNLAEHIYATAQSSKWVERTETHKVGLLGRADFQKYSDKIGVLGNDQWWLRDVQGILRANDGGDKQLGPIAVMAEWNVLQGSKQDAEKYIRPAFYLKEDFFRTVKLNVNKIGAKLRKMIIARYTDEELKAAGYSDIEIETLKSAFGVEITTSADGYNFFNHENAKVNIEILNETATPRTVSIEYTAEPLIGGSLVSDSKETAVPSGKSNQTVDLTALPNGKYNITFILKENGEEFYRHSEVFNITENVSAASDRVLSLGVSSVITEKDMEFLKNLGLNQARTVITWDSIETSKTGKGNYDFSGTDAYMAAAEKYGLKITAILAYGNTLYGTQTDKHALTGEAKTAFVNFVKEAVKRYPNVNSFEIWNEPNAAGFWNGDTADYITLAKETVAAIREINNDVKIYVGSIDVSQSNATNFADSLLKEKMDVNGISYHPYFHEGMNRHYGTAETHLTGKINTYNQIVLNNGGWVKLPATEIGYETHLGGVEKATWAQLHGKQLKP